jgi:hypothetical protein
MTMEEELYSPTGRLLTRGPGAYKIPGFGDIPAKLKVSLYDKFSNRHGLYHSKVYHIDFRALEYFRESVSRRFSWELVSFTLSVTQFARLILNPFWTGIRPLLSKESVFLSVIHSPLL